MNLIPGKITVTGVQKTVILNCGCKAVSNVPTIEVDMGGEVNIGLRPEDMVCSDDDDYLYRGTVNILEALREVTVLYFTHRGGREAVIAKLPGIHSGLRGR